jgi:hypothetical protein
MKTSFKFSMHAGFSFPLPALLAFLALAGGSVFDTAQAAAASSAASAPIELVWQSAPFQTCFVNRGGYGRVKRLSNGELALIYSDGPVKDTAVYIRKKKSAGTDADWGKPVRVATPAKPASPGENPDYRYVNSEMTELADGRLFYTWNARPVVRDGHLPYKIMGAFSSDKGATWSEGRDLYLAGDTFRSGCWEPFPIEIPAGGPFSKGELQVWFSDESTTPDGDQNITVLRSRDNGATWLKPVIACHRKGWRDGMPVPVLLQNNKGLVFSIEDNRGLHHRFNPAIIRPLFDGEWRGVVNETNPNRWSALAKPPSPADAYIGAPYLIQLDTGETVLSCQSTEGRTRDAKKHHLFASLRVYVGDADARNFTNPTTPFPDLPPTANALWNSICQIDHDTLVAVADIKGLPENNGLYIATAKIRRPGQPATASSPLVIAAIKNPSGSLGISAINRSADAVIYQPGPMRVSFWNGAPSKGLGITARGYAQLREVSPGEWLGTGVVRGRDVERIGAGAPHNAVEFAFTDRWSVLGNVLRLRREVRVSGDAPGGFNSVIGMRIAGARPWPEMEWFVPGAIYGNSGHLRDNSFGAANYYKPGNYTVWIREDRLPAPLFATRLPNGASVAVLNSAPDGATNSADGLSFTLKPMASEDFRFGALFAEERPNNVSGVGYAFPGSEGTLTYGPKGQAHKTSAVQLWRYRFSPLKDGFVHRYEVSFRLDSARDTNDLVARTWRWAWQTLKPQVNPQPVETLRRCMADVLLENFVEHGGVAGERQVTPSEANPIPSSSVTKSVLGFTGYAIGSAEMMLVEAARDPAAPRSWELRQAAGKIIATFLRLPVAPPVAEGFVLGGENNGALAADNNPMAKPLTDATPIYLRSFCDDMKSLMRAYEREQRAAKVGKVGQASCLPDGIGNAGAAQSDGGSQPLSGKQDACPTPQSSAHPEWLAWVRKFGDWLLTQELPGGGLPRTWHAVTGSLFDASPTGTFNAIPFYAQLYKITQHKPYLDAALRAGEFAWNSGHARARFTGGTIDNPDVIDKEAATISLEGYLALYNITRDQKWLDRARVAADVAETWMRIWNIPMPSDATQDKLHWPMGQSTVGMQLVATGHTGDDAYMAWDVESYARLSRETGDPHYMEVAQILLHNTKAMVGRPGDLRGTRGPGWQQEHCWLDLPRGRGRHRAWLPWVTVSHLRGINDLVDYDAELYKQLAAEK